MIGRRAAFGWVCAASVAVVVQAASNAMFAYELGNGHLPVEIRGVMLSAVGLALAAACGAIAVVQALAATAVLHGEPGKFRRTAGFILAFCMTYSVLGVSNHVLGLQQERVDRNKAAEQRHASAKALRDTAKSEADRRRAEFDRAKGLRDRAPEGRSLGDVGADIQALQIKADAWRASQQCTRIAEEWLSRACEPATKLFRERAAALERDRLADEFEAARAALSTAETALNTAETRLGATPKPDEPWPIRVVLAHAMAWMAAATIEVCGTLGFAMARQARDRSPGPAEQRPAPQPTNRPPRPQKPAAPGSLADTLRGIADGTVTAPGCVVAADGWIVGSQKAIGAVMGVTAATVCRDLADLEAAGVIATRKQGRGQAIKVM